MKHFISFFLFAAFIAVTSVNTLATGFEGVISMQAVVAQMGDQAIPITISTKGEKTLMEMSIPMGTMKIIMDRETGKMTTIMGQNGMQRDMNSDAKKNKKSDPDDTKVVATGEKKVINGHNCELYIVTFKDGESDMWVTSEMPATMLEAMKSSFTGGMQALSSRGGSGGGGFEEIFKKGLVPIQVEMKKDGKLNATVTVLSFEQKKLDDSVFEVPADVQIMQMPAGGR